MQIGWQAAVGSRQVSANLHDGLARVDRTAGDTWRRQRGGGYIVSAGRVGIGKQKADGMIGKDFARHEILLYFSFFHFFFAAIEFRILEYHFCYYYYYFGFHECKKEKMLE